MNIRLGLKFTSLLFPGTAEIIDIQETKNSVSIEIHNLGGVHQEDDIDLEELVQQFENKTCESIDTTKHLLNNKGELSDEGAYTD